MTGDIVPVEAAQQPGKVTLSENRDKEYYLNSMEPFEYIASLNNNLFLQEREMTRLAAEASNVGVKNFMKLCKNYLKQMAPKKNTAYSSNNYTEFTGQPTEYCCGRWIATDCGVYTITQFGEMEACCHPIIPVERLVNIDSGTEKLRLAYRKGYIWRNVIVDKRMLASSNKIVELADHGIAVNSENARYLVKYLHDVENLNYDDILEKNSVSRLGWIDNYGFSPYVDNLIFDGEANYRSFFESVNQHGDYNIWLDLAKSVRKGGITARILLAASFASVLIKPLQRLPFFVHLWGGTEVGKTVGLMLAASVWGNPEVGKYIHSFNSTNVGREKSAAFVNSLPLILDELQMIKTDKKQFDNEIYSLAEGSGRTRGNKSGGIDKTSQWANCILTNGEMPITSSRSGGGAVNRIIEIECKEKLFESAQHVADTVRKNYGFAGKMFVDLLQDDEIMNKVRDIFAEVYKQMDSIDTTEKQSMAAAMILTADAVVTKLIFDDDMALTVNDIKPYLSSKSSVSANGRGFQYIKEWISANSHKFPETGISSTGEVWGKMDQEGKHCFIMPSYFYKACDEAGYPPEPLLSYMKENRQLETDKNGKTTQTTRINKNVVRCIKVILQESFEEIPDDEFEQIPF